jgi:predicted DNA-binding ribbon-helix-helix protein
LTLTNQEITIPTMSDKDRKTLQVVLETAAYDMLKERAASADLTVSVFVRKLLEEQCQLPAFNSRRG